MGLVLGLYPSPNAIHFPPFHVIVLHSSIHMLLTSGDWPALCRKERLQLVLAFMQYREADTGQAGPPRPC